MVEKSISSYGDLTSQSPFNSDKLVVNVGPTYMCFIVRLHGKEEIAAFELFEFDKVLDNWYDVFYNVKNQSKILDRSYNHTTVLYNMPESVLIPAEKYSAESASDFLTTVFGEHFNQLINTDTLNINEPVVNAYGIKRSLFDIVGSNFLMVEARHYYSMLLNVLLHGSVLPSGTFLRLEFYKNTLVLVLIHERRLQLVQQYSTANADDMLYYVLSVLEQYRYKPSEVQLEVAGIIDTRTQDYDFLRKLFPHISFDTLNTAIALPELVEQYPAHYLSPFFKVLA